MARNQKETSFVNKADVPRVPLEGFRPTRNLIVVEQPRAKEKTNSGIILPDEMKSASRLSETNFFKVVKVGPDVKVVEVGDHILLTNMMELPFFGTEGDNQMFGLVEDYNVVVVFDVKVIEAAKNKAEAEERLAV